MSIIADRRGAGDAACGPPGQGRHGLRRRRHRHFDDGCALPRPVPAAAVAARQAARGQDADRPYPGIRRRAAASSSRRDARSIPSRCAIWSSSAPTGAGRPSRSSRRSPGLASGREDRLYGPIGHDGSAFASPSVDMRRARSSAPRAMTARGAPPGALPLTRLVARPEFERQRRAGRGPAIRARQRRGLEYRALHGFVVSAAAARLAQRGIDDLARRQLHHLEDRLRVAGQVRAARSTLPRTLDWMRRIQSASASMRAAASAACCARTCASLSACARICASRSACASLLRFALRPAARAIALLRFCLRLSFPRACACLGLLLLACSSSRLRALRPRLFCAFLLLLRLERDLGLACIRLFHDGRRLGRRRGLRLAVRVPVAAAGSVTGRLRRAAHRAPRVTGSGLRFCHCIENTSTARNPSCTAMARSSAHHLPVIRRGCRGRSDFSITVRA